MIVLTETKCDDIDSAVLTDIFEGFKCIFKNRENTSRKSGGIAILIKDCYKDKIIVHESDCKYVQWISLDSSILQLDKDVLIGGIYVPPEGSEYVNRECFEDITNDMVSLNDNKYVLLLGDFNGHTKCDDDIVKFDKYVFDEVLDEIVDLDVHSVNLPSRISKDKHKVNWHGRQILEFCKSHNLFIYNGRTGTDRNVGEFTTTKDSIVDYVVGCPGIWDRIMDFEVLTFDSTCSDIHCPITLHCQIKFDIVNDTNGVLNTSENNVENFIKNKRY